MPVGACRAAVEWAGWICKRDGRSQRVQATVNKPSLCWELELEACFVTPPARSTRRGLTAAEREAFVGTPFSRA